MSLPVAPSNGISKKGALYFDSARYLAVFFILFVFMGLRGFVFFDCLRYAKFYNELPSLLDGMGAVARSLQINQWEKGFILFSILLKTISGDYFFFQCVCSLINIAILFALFKRYVPDQVVLCFAFFCAFFGVMIDCNSIRNAKGIMLFLISLKYVQERKMLPYFLLNILGSLFHASSLVYLPFYFVLNRRFSVLFYLLIFAVGNFFYLFQIRWVYALTGYVESIAGYHRLFRIAANYLNSSNPAITGQIGISIGYIERTFTYILLLCLSRRLCEKSKANVIFINMMFLYILLNLYFTEARILGRIETLFIAGYWLVYPQVYSLLKKDFKLLFLALFLLYAVIKFLYGFSSIGFMYENVLWPRYTYEERAYSEMLWVRYKYGL